LFEKIEDTVVEAQLQKLENAAKANMQDALVEPAKEEITFPDFEKIDMRVATILSAEKVKKSKKLLKLKLDTGIDERIVLSGIAQHYQPEEIVGKQVCVLVNLAPRKMMGTESQGMVLMAENADGKLSFLRPEDVVKNGSMIS
jgi:methionyl-tRNA synthetase